MLFRMKRTQTNDHGTFRCGVAYDTGKDSKLDKMAKEMIAAGLAESVTEKQLEKEKAAAEQLTAAPSKGDEAAAKAEAEAKAKAEADAAAKAKATTGE